MVRNECDTLLDTKSRGGLSTELLSIRPKISIWENHLSFAKIFINWEFKTHWLVPKTCCNHLDHDVKVVITSFARHRITGKLHHVRRRTLQATQQVAQVQNVKFEFILIIKTQRNFKNQLNDRDMTVWAQFFWNKFSWKFFRSNRQDEVISSFDRIDDGGRSSSAVHWTGQRSRTRGHQETL